MLFNDLIGGVREENILSEWSWQKIKITCHIKSLKRPVSNPHTIWIVQLICRFSSEKVYFRILEEIASLPNILNIREIGLTKPQHSICSNCQRKSFMTWVEHDRKYSQSQSSYTGKRPLNG